MAAKEKADVQGYLAKHKVAALFEDLMAKVIKQLPNDPVEFLIRKLQVLHQKQKKTSVPTVASISPVKAVPPGSKIQVTGTTVASKSSKLPISDHLSKSTSGLRPIKSKCVGQPSAALSKTTPVRASQTTPIRGSQVPPTRELVRPSTNSGSKIGKATTKSKPAVSSIARPLSGSRTAMARPSTAPDPSRTKSSQLPVRSSSKDSPAIHRKKLPPSPATSSPRTPHKATPIKQSLRSSEKSGPSLSRDMTKEEGGEVGVVKEADEIQIDEFFGEGKKSSHKKLFLVDEDGEDVGGAFVSDDDDNDDDDDEHAPNDHGYQSVEDILVETKKKKRGRHTQQKSYHQTFQDLIKEEEKERGVSSLSTGYHDSSDTSSDGEIWLEDEDTLRDEGVVVARGARAVPRHSMSTTSTIGEGMFCARCSRALEDAGSALSGPDSSVPPTSDFESASQVAAGQVMFPQWTNEGGQSMESDLTSSSQLTARTDDTWGGLAPKAAPQLHSDEESEVHIPVAAPLKTHTWAATDTPLQSDPYGWGQHN